jgi:hypothetical protein
MLDLDAVPRMTAPVIATPSEPAPVERLDDDVPTVEDPPPPRRWPVWAAIAAIGVVGIVIALVVVTGSGGDGAAVAQVDDAGTDAVTALANEDVAVDAGADPVVVAAATIDAGAASTKRSDRKKDRERSETKVDAAVERAAVSPPVEDPIPDPPVDVPPPAPTRGRIAVTSNPYGKVTINGKGYGYTDLLEKLSPGTYSVEVALSDGSGTYSTTARIDSDKKTKCQVRNKRLSCGSPR